jgi:hypothetical protein
MANAMYPLGLKAILDGDVDLLTDNIKVVLLDAGYTYSAAHDFLDDIAGAAVVATSGNLASKTTTAGVFDAADVTFVALTGDDVVAYVVYKDTGSSATSQLLCYVDTAADTSAILVEPDGTDFTLRWNSAGIFVI